ncbi:MAG: hypothetical protein EOO73_17935 [Myxococcales bacterium]|nr:MAG: hypothetical protein EOO73_17935 [Myxococcales bacterium]
MFGRRPFLSSVSFSVVLAIASSLVGCGGNSEVKHANVKPGALPEGGEWNGVYYSTTFGYLHLVSDNKSANGAWRTTAGDAWGEMSGEVDGDLLRFQWTERKIGAIGADATKKGHGYFRYTIPTPGEPHKIVGEWGLGESDAGAPWEAVKQIRMEPKPESVKPDEIEGRTNVGGWDDSEEKPKDSGDSTKSDGDPAAP